MSENASPESLVETAPPRVTLRNAFAHPFDSAIAAARTCYSSRLITPEEITDKRMSLYILYFIVILMPKNHGQRRPEQAAIALSQ